MNGEYNMRILICDDDLLIVEKLQKYLKSYFSHLHLSCPEIVCFSDGESLLADPGDKDILFLDIEMPGLDGIYVGNELKKKEKDIMTNEQLVVRIQAGEETAANMLQLWQQTQRSDIKCGEP